MPPVVYPSNRVQSERTIALARVALAATASFALLLDPFGAAGQADMLYWVYLSYAVLLAIVTLRWDGGDKLPAITHVLDIIAFSGLQYLTFGPSSPFYIYFVFSMFCAAMRWGWRGTLVTSVTVLVFYIALAVPLLLRGSAEFELNRFVIRVAYLVVSSVMLVYLGRYEARLRLEIERLARWPRLTDRMPDAAAALILEYSARLMHAGCVLVLWEPADRSAINEARWTAAGVQRIRHRADTIRIVTDDAFRQATFICTGEVSEARHILTADAAGRLLKHPGLPLDPAVVARLPGSGLASARFKTDLVSGRVFFSDLGTPPTEAVPLTEVVTREIAASLEQYLTSRQRQEIAAREERIRVARDLHDGVLQGLTGVRLELRAMATHHPDSPEALREQLNSLERALAMEQRELRQFISELEPGPHSRLDRASSFVERLESVRERLTLEWKLPITLRISSHVGAVPAAVEDALPLMINEAVVNALKHGHPSRVSVDVDVLDGQLRIAVSDDGRGFPFKGRFDHDALAGAHEVPRSLFDRVSALGGHLSIESSDRGARVEMLLSL